MGDRREQPVPAVPRPRDPIGEAVARLVAEAPRFTPAKLARLSMIMAPAFAAMDAAAEAEAAAPAMQPAA